MVRGVKQAKTTFEVLRDTVMAFIQDDCPGMAASLAYYTLFSLPPLIVLVAYVAGFVFEPEQIDAEIDKRVTEYVGEDASQQLDVMVSRAEERAQGPLWTRMVGLGVLAFAATGAFAQIQNALNKAWNVMPDPRYGGVRGLVLKRITSALMIGLVSTLLLASLIASTAVTTFNALIASYLPVEVSGYALAAVNEIVSLGIFTLLFAIIFKIMPDARVHWRDIGIGAFATAVLFSLGSFAIKLYLANSAVNTAYGAASSLAVLMVWSYYSALILFLGAEFTQVWATRTGNKIQPLYGAREVVLRRKEEG